MTFLYTGCSNLILSLNNLGRNFFCIGVYFCNKAYCEGNKYKLYCIVVTRGSLIYLGRERGGVLEGREKYRQAACFIEYFGIG